MRRVHVSAALALCLTLLALPASAASEPVGDQLWLLDSCFTGSIDPQPADTPFHVLHGWWVNPADTDDIGQSRFDLSIDGEEYKGKLVVETTKNPDALGMMSRRYLYDFTDGLSAGTYAFHAVWSVPEGSPGIGIDCPLEIEFVS